jgi:hypothetical protein
VDNPGFDDTTRSEADILCDLAQWLEATYVRGRQTGSTTVTFGAQNSGFQAGVINGPISGISFGGKVSIGQVDYDEIFSSDVY